MNKQQLKELLQEKDVQEMILAIVQGKSAQAPIASTPLVKEAPLAEGESEEMLESIQKMLDNLRTCLSGNRSKQHDLQNKLDALQKDHQVLQQNHQVTKDDLSKTTEACARYQEEAEESNKHLTFFRDNFSPFVKAYEKFESLGDDSKDALQGIFKTSGLVGFVAAGVQQRNVETFYDYLKNELIEGDNPDIPALRTIFETFMTYYLMAYPKYEKLTPKKGEPFDANAHIKIGDAVSGNIQELLVAGWQDSKIKKVKKQPIVKLSGLE